MYAYGERDPRATLTGFEAGLLAIWKFDEGRGTVTVDSASLRLKEGITQFGVVSPTIAVPTTAASLLTSTPSHGGTEALERPKAPFETWAVSTAPVGTLVRSHDSRSFIFHANGSDAHTRPLLAVLTRIPSGGLLSVAAPIGEHISEGYVEQAELKVGDSIPVGTRLLYRPNAGAHDPWLDGTVGKYPSTGDWTVGDLPYDWMSFRVETEAGESSANDAVVALSVRPGLNAAHLDWPIKVCGCAAVSVK